LHTAQGSERRVGELASKEADPRPAGTRRTNGDGAPASDRTNDREHGDELKHANRFHTSGRRRPPLVHPRRIGPDVTPPTWPNGGHA
jgi:hypothetical protein